MGKTIQDGTASFAVRDKRIKALVDLFFPIGSIIARDDGNEPEILKYGKWEKIAPGRVLQGVGGGVTGEAGQDVEPGLPNITGSVNFTGGPWQNESSPKGAFLTERNNRPDGGSSGSEGMVLSFDASKSNSIYGASDTVQPAAHIVVFWKRIE